MSEVLDKIKSRRSIRKYRSDMIPQDKLEKIIEAGTYAATGMGKQSPIIIAVTNKELRDKLSAMNAKIMGVDSDPFYGAPTVIVVFADKACRPTYVEDGSFLRVKNITLRYRFPSNWVKRIGMTNLSAYLTVNNLWCFTKYSGVDPEISICTDTAKDYYGIAVDNSMTPRAKEWTFGLSATF